jgi:DMSO reductase anchor subunit
MGFRIARKHAVKLHRIAIVAGFVASALLLLSAIPGHSIVALIACTLAVPLVAAGLLVERWLFFAEAQHTVSLYYA